MKDFFIIEAWKLPGYTKELFSEFLDTNGWEYREGKFYEDRNEIAVKESSWHDFLKEKAIVITKTNEDTKATLIQRVESVTISSYRHTKRYDVGKTPIHSMVVKFIEVRTQEGYTIVNTYDAFGRIISSDDCGKSETSPVKVGFTFKYVSQEDYDKWNPFKNESL